jgi:ABC-type nitrate/sulfonate/bicarbonate transport system permease component
MLRMSTVYAKLSSKADAHHMIAAEKYLWFASLACIFLSWEMIVRLGIVPASKLPSFSTALLTLISCLSDAGFLALVGQSFLNLTAGILVALAIAMPLALFAGLRNRLDTAITPLIMLAGALPDIALLPILVLWIGPGNAAAISIAAFSAFFPMYFTIREGTKDIPKDLFHVAAVFDTGRFDTFRKLILPAVSPQLFTGLRLAYDFVWEIVLAIEIFSGVAGIGSFISGAVETGGVNEAFAAILAVGILAIAVDRLLFGRAEKWIRRWMD